MAVQRARAGAGIAKMCENAGRLSLVRAGWPRFGLETIEFVPRVNKRVQMVLLTQRFFFLAPVLYLELSLWAGPPYSARGARIGVWQAIIVSKYTYTTTH